MMVSFIQTKSLLKSLKSRFIISSKIHSNFINCDLKLVEFFWKLNYIKSDKISRCNSAKQTNHIIDQEEN